MNIWYTFLIYVIYFRALSELWACDRSESAPNGDPSVCRCHHHRCSLRASPPSSPQPCQHQDHWSTFPERPRSSLLPWPAPHAPLGLPTPRGSDVATQTASSACLLQQQFGWVEVVKVRLGWIERCRVAGSGSISESSSTSGDQEGEAPPLGPQLYLQPEYQPGYGQRVQVGFIAIYRFILTSGWLIKGHILGNALSPIGPCILALSQWSHPYLVTTNRSGYNKPNFSISL